MSAGSGRHWVIGCIRRVVMMTAEWSQRHGLTHKKLLENKAVHEAALLTPRSQDMRPPYALYLAAPRSFKKSWTDDRRAHRVACNSTDHPPPQSSSLPRMHHQTTRKKKYLKEIEKYVLILQSLTSFKRSHRPKLKNGLPRFEANRFEPFSLEHKTFFAPSRRGLPTRRG